MEQCPKPGTWLVPLHRHSVFLPTVILQFSKSGPARYEMPTLILPTISSNFLLHVLCLCTFLGNSPQNQSPEFSFIIAIRMAAPQ